MVGIQNVLTQQQRNELEEAIRAAESRTDGEIVTVVASSCDNPLEDTTLLAALVALLLPACVVWWTGGTAVALYTGQILTFFSVIALLNVRADWRHALWPSSLQRERVRRHAVEQFHALGLHRTDAQAGVLIFVSMAEKRVEILADSGIDGRVNSVAWRRVVSALVARVQRDELHQGFKDAVTACADIMADALPATRAAQNSLTDKLIVIAR